MTAYCKKCGTENKDSAKFCKECGAPLSATTNEQAASAQADASAAKTGEADRAATNQARQPGAAARAAASAKPRKLSSPAIIGGIAAVVIVVAIAVVMVMGGRIGEKEFKEALQDGNMLTIQEGDYNDESQLNVDSVKITSNEKATGDDAAMARVFYGTDELHEVTGNVKLSNDAAEVDETVTCYFMKDNNKWVPVGSPDVQGDAAWTAKQGPAEDKVQENITEIVNQALSNSNGSWNSSGIPANARADSDAYTDADVSISDSRLNDDGTATVAISAKRDGGYFTCGGNVTATFEFNKGNWTLKSADSDDSLRKIDFSSIVGTWTGSCTTPDCDCGAADGGTVSVNITSFDATTGNLEGTVTSLAHFHKSSECNAGADTTVTDVPFSAKLTPSGSDLSGEATIQQDAGTIYLNFSFDSGSSNPMSESKGSTVSVECSPSGSIWDWSYYTDGYSITKAA